MFCINLQLSALLLVQGSLSLRDHFVCQRVMPLKGWSLLFYGKIVWNRFVFAGRDINDAIVIFWKLKAPASWSSSGRLTCWILIIIILDHWALLLLCYCLGILLNGCVLIFYFELLISASLLIWAIFNYLRVFTWIDIGFDFFVVFTNFFFFRFCPILRLNCQNRLIMLRVRYSLLYDCLDD